MATVNDIYRIVCADLLESSGLQLGIVTVPQFFEIFNTVLLDFLNKTGIVKRVFTQSVMAGVSQYTIPDEILRVDDAFISGQYLEKTTLAGLTNARVDWRRKLDVPQAWHEDSLPEKMIELAPIPSYNGSYIEGENEPAPPHANWDTFWPTVNGIVQSPRQARALSVVGPQKPTLVSSFDDEIPLLPDMMAGYLTFGVLERIFGSDGEMKDAQREFFCRSQLEEGINLCRTIAGEFHDGD